MIIAAKIGDVFRYKNTDWFGFEALCDELCDFSDRIFIFYNFTEQRIAIFSEQHFDKSTMTLSPGYILRGREVAISNYDDAKSMFESEFRIRLIKSSSEL
jgi:hypothetical protein